MSEPCDTSVDIKAACPPSSGSQASPTGFPGVDALPGEVEQPILATRRMRGTLRSVIDAPSRPRSNMLHTAEYLHAAHWTGQVVETSRLSVRCWPDDLTSPYCRECPSGRQFRLRRPGHPRRAPTGCPLSSCGTASTLALHQNHGPSPQCQDATGVRGVSASEVSGFYTAMTASPAPCGRWITADQDEP